MNRQQKAEDIKFGRKKEGVSDVNNIIFNLFNLDLWKIIFLWNKSGMGNFKISFNDRIFPRHFNWNAFCWIDSSGISVAAYYRCCSDVWNESLSL